MKLLYLLLLCFTIYPIINGQTKIKLKEETKITDDRIGMVQGIDVDSKGNIYVGDLINKKVFKYSNKGVFLEEIGKRGSGPGEFRSVVGLKIFKDTLFVLDFEQLKICAYSIKEKTKLSYELKIPLHPKGLNPVVLGNERQGINGLWIVDDTNFLILFGKYSSTENLNGKKTVEGLLINRKGDLISTKPLFKVSDREMIVNKGESGFATAPMPYGKTGLINTDGNGNVFYMDNDIQLITKLYPVDERSQEIKFSGSQVFANEKIQKTLLSELPSEFVKLLEKSKTPFPKYLPVCENFFIDKEQIWLSGYNKNLDVLTWQVIDTKGKKLDEFEMRRTDLLLLKKDNFIYGLRNNKNGAQEVICLKLLE